MNECVQDIQAYMMRRVSTMRRDANTNLHRVQRSGSIEEKTIKACLTAERAGVMSKTRRCSSAESAGVCA